MNYLVEGVNFHNKGAELMLLAIQQQLATWNQKHVVSLKLRIGNRWQRDNANVKHLIWYESDKFPWVDSSLDIFCGNLPQLIRHRFNILLKSEIDVVLDASGFCFSDQWGVKAAQLKRETFEFWKNKGKKIILLPQAFGPFNKPEIKEEFSQVLKLADLIFARDKESFSYIKSVSKNLDNVKISPDFTNLVNPKIPFYARNLMGKPCIIPNARMLDKTDAYIRESYLNLLLVCIEYLQNKGLEPFILIHEVYDIELAQNLKTLNKERIQIVRELNPLCLKGVLSNCSFVIGSRFHGLVSALSQGIPCLGTGWSHKYKTLFSQYNCPEFLIEFDDQLLEVMSKIEMLISGSQRESVIRNIKSSSKKQKDLSLKMWGDVKDALMV